MYATKNSQNIRTSIDAHKVRDIFIFLRVPGRFPLPGFLVIFLYLTFTYSLYETKQSKAKQSKVKKINEEKQENKKKIKSKRQE